MVTSKSIKQRLVSGGLWATAAKLVVAFGGLALNALLTRLLPPQEVGAYFLIVSIATIGALLVQLGTHQAIVPLIAAALESPDASRVGRYVRAAFACFFLATALVGGIYWQIGGQWLGEVVFGSPLVAAVSGLTAVWIGLRGLQTLGSQILRGFHRIGLASVFEGALTSVLIVAVLAAVLVRRGQSSLGEVLMVTVAVLAVTTAMNIWSIGTICRQAGCGKGYDFSTVLKASLPLFVVSIAVPGIAEAHLWVLGEAVSEAEVAIYGAAYRVARVVVIPLLIINSVIPPMIAQLLAQGKQARVERVLRAAAVAAGVPSVVIVLLLAAGGTPLLGLLFGDYYAEGAGVLLILVAAQAVNALTGSPGVLLVASARQAVVMRFALLSGMLGLLVSIVAVDRFGYIGVAWGVAFGLVAHNVGMWAYCIIRMGVKTHMGVAAIGDVTGVFIRRLWCVISRKD